MKRRSTFFAMAVLAALALSASAAHAANVNKVTDDSGELGLYTLANTTQAGAATNTLSLSFDTAAFPQLLGLVNGQETQPGGIPASFTNPITFTATPSGLNVWNLSGANNLTKTFGTGSATAILDFTLTRLGSASPDSAVISGSVTSVAANNLSGYDFSNFAQGGPLFLGFTGTSFTGGASSFADVLSKPGTSVSGFGVFSEAAVPEPTSMTLLGIGLSGLFAFRHFLKRALFA